MAGCPANTLDDVADNVLARWVAEEIGVGERMIETQRATWARWEYDPTEFLKHTLDHWDMRPVSAELRTRPVDAQT